MIIDCNVKLFDYVDEVDDIIDDAIEDFGIEIFILQPTTLKELELSKELIANPRIFFAPNLSNEITKKLIKSEIKNPKCVAVGFTSGDFDELLEFDLSIFVNSKIDNLKDKNINQKLIFNYINDSILENGYLLINPNIELDRDFIEKLPLDKILFSSNYPFNNIEEESKFLYITNIAKDISNINFRAEQKILAEATRTSREILRFK